MDYLLTSFASLPDFCINRRKLYDLTEIVFMSACGVICGCDDYVSIKSWSDDNIVWLRQYLALANGIPSDDTFVVYLNTLIMKHLTGVLWISPIV